MPTRQTGTVLKPAAPPPPSRPYRERRQREYLTEAEVDKLRQAARQRGRYGERDATAILLAYMHGLRVSELCALTWPQVDFASTVLHVNRHKNGRPSTQPLYGREVRELRKLRRAWPQGRFVFQNERGAPLSAAGFRKTLARIGEAASLGFPVHPHMLRHGCGYKLANQGVDTRTLQQYLGHRSIEHTVRYTELAADRFADLWKPR
jgi:type 1 fimbriae regulatory protein FimB/type 1 fimbriae regulatory protein FimE